MLPLLVALMDNIDHSYRGILQHREGPSLHMQATLQRDWTGMATPQTLIDAGEFIKSCQDSRLHRYLTVNEATQR